VRPRPDLTRGDIVVAAALALFSGLVLEVTRSIGVLEHVAAPVWAQWLAVLTGAALLVGRRRWPLTVTGLAAVHMFVVGVTMAPIMSSIPMQIIYFYAIFSGVAWARDRRSMLLVVGAVLTFMFGWVAWQFAAGSAADEVVEQFGGTSDADGLMGPFAAIVLYSFLINILYFGGAVLGGQVAWRGARQRARLADQASTIAAQADGLRRKAVLDERLRIARELHDVAAHHVAVIGIQAGAARSALDKRPEAAAASLSAVEVASREAVREMRSLLGTLRTLEDERHDDSRTPEPGLADLPELVASIDHQGLEVTLHCVEDPPGSAEVVPRPVQLSLYRTAQEALANTVRHSSATRVGVTVRATQVRSVGGYVELEVVDNGRPRPGTSDSGLGLLGVRERAAHHRAEVEIGPRLGGGYRVRLRVPLHSQDPSAAAPRPDGTAAGGAASRGTAAGGAASRGTAAGGTAARGTAAGGTAGGGTAGGGTTAGEAAVRR
jgi:signal transduction histidine kinase